MPWWAPRWWYAPPPYYPPAPPMPPVYYDVLGLLMAMYYLQYQVELLRVYAELYRELAKQLAEAIKPRS